MVRQWAPFKIAAASREESPAKSLVGTGAKCGLDGGLDQTVAWAPDSSGQGGVRGAGWAAVKRG